ncbi:MAG: RNA polymerase sigma factor [Candidatus Merdivicinus sp.]|jgi:RNA polymerase sigma factor (sigma-70 family)
MTNLLNLVSAAKKGDKSAFSQLYQEVYQDLYKFAFYCLKNETDAEDAVSDAVMDAWESLPKLRQDDSFRAWMFKILSAKCKRKMKYYAARREETDLSEVEIPVTADREEALELKRAMALLNDEERLILSLIIFGGYDSGEVADMLRLNRNTVRSKHSRALAKLREALSQ